MKFFKVFIFLSSPLWAQDKVIDLGVTGLESDVKRPLTQIFTGIDEGSKALASAFENQLRRLEEECLRELRNEALSANH